MVGLLTVGSKAKPNEKLQIGEAGTKQLVAVREEGQKGLAAFLREEKGAIAGILDERGLPPMPVGMSRTSGNGGKKYVVDVDRSEGYPEE